MKRKDFKIGECAIGGIIRISINDLSIVIQAVDYFSKNLILNNEFLNKEDSYWKMKDFVSEITTSYYTDKVMEYIVQNSNVTFKHFR
jgi:hypothetical protein